EQGEIERVGDAAGGEIEARLVAADRERDREPVGQIGATEAGFVEQAEPGPGPLLGHGDGAAADRRERQAHQILPGRPGPAETHRHLRTVIVLHRLPVEIEADLGDPRIQPGGLELEIGARRRPRGEQAVADARGPIELGEYAVGKAKGLAVELAPAPRPLGGVDPMAQAAVEEIADRAARRAPAREAVVAEFAAARAREREAAVEGVLVERPRFRSPKLVELWAGGAGAGSRCRFGDAAEHVLARRRQMAGDRL